MPDSKPRVAELINRRQRGPALVGPDGARAMVCDAVASGSHKPEAARATDLRAAAFVLVVRDAADAGPRADGVVLDADERGLGFRMAGR